MRNLENFEMQAVGGAVIRYEGCIVTVSSKGISARDFGIIEQHLQYAIDGKMSYEQADAALRRAGISQSALDAYSRNLDSANFICV